MFTSILATKSPSQIGSTLLKEPTCHTSFIVAYVFNLPQPYPEKASGFKMLRGALI